MVSADETALLYLQIFSSAGADDVTFKSDPCGAMETAVGPAFFISALLIAVAAAFN